MNKHLAIVIDWYGPYNSFEELNQVTREDYAGGLYVAIGRRKFEKKRWLQYVGISDYLRGRVNVSHPKLKLLKQECIIWLGEIVSTGVPGKRQFKKETTLEIAEWAHTYFVGFELNKSKTVNLPDFPFTVMNRWWKTDYDTRYQKRPHSDWPDLIDFCGVGDGSRLVWLNRTRGKIEHVEI